MRNWSVDEKYIKQFPKEYKLWQLEQTVSYGLDDEKLDKKELILNWDYLKKRIDPKRLKFLEFLLWPKRS